MEIRKLQRTGGSSLTITLPKKWIEGNGLKDKDLIKLQSPHPHTLLLQPTSSKRRTYKATMHIDSLSIDVLTRELMAHYIIGIDEVTIESQRISPEQRSKIRKIANSLTGFEIIDESSECIVLKNIFDPAKFPIPKNIEKMFSVTILMFEDALHALTKADKSLAQDVIGRDFEINKLHLVILRQRHSLAQDKITQEEIGLNLGELHYFEDVATQLERIADHAAKIARITLENPKGILSDSKKAEITANKIKSLLEQAKVMVEKFDRTQAHNILDANPKVKSSTPSKKEVTRKELLALHLLEDSFERVVGYITNIAEITIDISIQRENE